MNRSPFQGVITVVRFNWHLYAIALFAAATLIVISSQVPAWIAPHSRVVASLILLSTGLSLAATWLAYDSSELYALKWLRPWIPAHGNAANIHAGFDETTLHLRATFPNLNWRVFDFYDPAHHTEVSIRRARVLLMLAAHEIRDPAERTAFFAELYRALAPDGRLIITEHLRDLPNIAAYNLGAWHFHSRSTWYAAFAASHFDLVTTFRPAPFITTFILKKHGSST
jgi:hypothetical protein